MELVQLEPAGEPSPLAAARLARHLTVDEAARRAGLPPDQVTWLEEGRVYRFPSADDALVATLLYASALGIEHREARRLAGLPVPALPPRATRLARIVAAAAAVVGAIVLVIVVLVPSLAGGRETPPARRYAGLPAPWKIQVDVLNGGGDINYTRRVASRVGALGYQIDHVTRANRFDYPDTAVYYEPGGDVLGLRLAHALGVPAKPLPGGSNPRRLVVIVGPQRGP
jgi:transcriptional regulator with XRE-family HTH domain